MTQFKYHYRLYGLRVASDFLLVEGEEIAPGAVDVTIARGHVAGIGDPAKAFRYYTKTPLGDVLQLDWVGRFLVSGGNRIVVDLDHRFDRHLLGMPLLGPVFGVLFHRRGHLVLHGSAIEVDGKAHVFLGDKGAGKSTTAVSLVAGGARLISDDVVVLQRGPAGRWCVAPSFGAMKIDNRLQPDLIARGFVGLDDQVAGLNKRRIRVPMVDAPVPIDHIHALERGPIPGFVPFDKAQALHTLIRFAYYPRMDGDALQPVETASVFRYAAAALGGLAVGRLTVKDDLSAVGEIPAFLAEVCG